MNNLFIGTVALCFNYESANFITDHSSFFVGETIGQHLICQCLPDQILGCTNNKFGSSFENLSHILLRFAHTKQLKKRDGLLPDSVEVFIFLNENFVQLDNSALVPSIILFLSNKLSKSLSIAYCCRILPSK